MTFDMQAAREICCKLDLKYPARSCIDDEYQCALAAEMLPAALDRIAELEVALQIAAADEISCRIFRKCPRHCTAEERDAALKDALHHVDEYVQKAHAQLYAEGKI